MSLIIKTKEAQRLARELPTLTGESVTSAVTQALRKRLDRVRQERNGGLADRLLAMPRDRQGLRGAA
jgi:antitoxin VapB